MTEICEHCSNLSSLRQCGIKNGNLKFQGIAKYVNCFGKRYFFAYAIDIHRYPSGCWIVSGVTMGHPHQTTNKWVEPPTLEMKVVVGCTTLFNRSCELNQQQIFYFLSSTMWPSFSFMSQFVHGWSPFLSVTCIFVLVVPKLSGFRTSRGLFQHG